MRNTKIQTDPDGLARCPHRNLFGGVCEDCFEVTPNLAWVGGQTYRMLPDAFRADWVAEGLANGMVRVSPTTKGF